MPEEPIHKKKVAVIHTGGTIFMHRTERGLDTGRLEVPHDKDGKVSSLVDFELIDLFGKGGKDSSKLTLAESKKLAKKIVELQNDKTVDGIVVTHGTDTMAETALELSYALKNMYKPVVLTGAVKPSEEKDSDGPRNFYRSVYLAAHARELRKVVICFGYRKHEQRGIQLSPEVIAKEGIGANFILDARNAEKFHVSRQDAFLHPTAKILGTISVKHGFKADPRFTFVPRPQGETHLHFNFSRLTSRRVLQRHTTRLPWLTTGLVAEIYGAGNAPEKVIAALARRVKFFPVIAALQARGNIDMTAYAAGLPALEAGVLPAGGHSALSASKRLSYLLGSRWQIRRFAWQRKLNYRKLLSTLFLSGAEFDTPEIKKKHADKLGVPITPEDLLVQISFKRALARAADALEGFEAKKEKQRSGTGHVEGAAKRRAALETPSAEIARIRAERAAKREKLKPE